jgi:hypothetical protein
LFVIIVLGEVIVGAVNGIANLEPVTPAALRTAGFVYWQVRAG